jgi:predicted ATP-grasp superfamily ATP-dependent carboligase
LKILIYEYFSSGAGGAHALEKDGFAIADALLRDLSRIPALELITVLSKAVTKTRPAGFLGERIAIRSGGESEDGFREALAQCDSALIIAPETRGISARLTGIAESMTKLLGSSQEAVALAGDKAATARLWEGGALPMPRWAILERAGLPKGFSFPVIVKPVRGAGGEGVRIIRSPAQLEAWIAYQKDMEAERFLVQELVSGEAVSVSCFVRDGKAEPLCLNLQHIGAEDTPVFLGVTVPYRHRLAKQAMELAGRACGMIPGLKGLVGVDLILGPEGPVVLEINPRPTFAYLGLRRAASRNLAELLLACSEEASPFRESQFDIKLKGSYTCLIRKEGARSI